MIDYTTKYAEDVIKGTIPAGKLVIKACQRHLDDLERQDTEKFPYIFDIKKANRAFRFFESLKFTDGELRGQPVKLVDFQYFIIGSLFGWLNRDGYRRFKKSYTQLARKQAKSLLNSGIGIYTSSFCNYYNAQVYVTATKMAQAKIVWEQSKKFINIEKDLDEMFKAYDKESLIKNKITGGKILALGRDTKSIDGFEPYCGIIDEYHLHPTEQMVKLLQDGTINLKESLISIITTAGFNLNSPCKKEYDYCVNVLNEMVENDRYFIYIAQMDKEDDPWDTNNWFKCAPLARHLPHAFESMKELGKEAKDKGGQELANFFTKTLNMWYEYTDSQYINISKWKECSSDLSLENMKGRTCIVGIDLSSGGDLTSLSLNFKLDNDKYFIHSHSFMPSNRLLEHEMTDKAPYRVWVKKGLLTLTETLGGVKTDYKYIISYLKELINKYNLKVEAIAYDPHNADAFLSDLEEIADPIMIVQSCKSLNDATVDFKLEVDANNILYNKESALLSWSFANAKTVSNSFGEIKIDKDFKNNRIDPCDAVINAHKIMFKQEKPVDLNKYLTDDYLNKLYGGS